MARIQDRNDRHFIDENGQMFWINGPDNCCYLSEQRQWRSGLSFLEVLNAFVYFFFGIYNKHVDSRYGNGPTLVHSLKIQNF